MGLKFQTYLLSRPSGPAPMLFDRVNTLTDEALNTIKGVVGLAGAIFLLWVLFQRQGTARLLMAAATVCIGIWLIALGGVETVAALFGQTLET